MVITKDHIGGLAFLCLSAAYGYYAGDISMIPGDEYEPFNAQTLPKVLALLGCILSIALILNASRNGGERLSLKGYDFSIVVKLLALVVLFGLALEWFGFLISTVIFLIGGYWVLGERRWKTLILASLPFGLFIWFALSQLLDIYLAPGRLITMLFGV